ncbi:MAG: hypothetical protein M1817_003066 [Caeruleum heppii]|nr:MAG: hypothetical protein M1817_003066 [Caeruleum heppii]
MTERSVDHGGTQAQKTIQEAGFSEDLKKQLEERIAASTFQAENASAITESNLPSSAGQGSRTIATSAAWTGTEEPAHAVLRMLTDAHKPLKAPRPAPIPTPRVFRARGRSSGQRLINARDRSSIYAISRDPNLTAEEKEQMRRDLKERFTPASASSTATPATLSGLASLANSRIEAAISKGSFKNISLRGKAIERDHTASSPFLDTTEYFMNKIIQKQEIVPPWIEKQQELSRAVEVFRQRLRKEWKRHVARSIASEGGTLEEQMLRAKRFAEAEEAVNPKARVKRIDKGVVEVLAKTAEEDDESALAAATAVDTLTSLDSPVTNLPPSSASSSPIPPSSSPTITTSNPTASPTTPSPTTTTPHPFRSPPWLSLETPYLTLSIQHLNTLTRSYNLLAPSLAKKPSFNLDRELLSCYADVAPLVAAEILGRARGGRRDHMKGAEEEQPRKVGVLEHWSTAETVRIREDTRATYGLGDFWRDLWGGKGG